MGEYDAWPSWWESGNFWWKNCWPCNIFCWAYFDQWLNTVPKPKKKKKEKLCVKMGTGVNIFILVLTISPDTQIFYYCSSIMHLRDKCLINLLIYLPSLKQISDPFLKFNLLIAALPNRNFFIHWWKSWWKRGKSSYLVW